MTTSQIKKHNQLLARELGPSPQGSGIYEWRWSEDLLHPMFMGEFEWKADPQSQSGLLVPRPVIQMRKLCPLLKDQWVLCMWLAPMPREKWDATFGSKYDYPSKGEWGPTSVDLEPGVEPATIVRGQTMTDLVINAIRQERKKTFKDRIAESEAEDAYADKVQTAKIEGIVEEAAPAFGNVPGRKMGISFPSKEVSAQA